MRDISLVLKKVYSSVPEVTNRNFPIVAAEIMPLWGLRTEDREGEDLGHVLFGLRFPGTPLR